MSPYAFALALALIPLAQAAYADAPAPPAPKLVVRRTRLVLAVKNGEAYGLKVFAIQPGSVYARAGFRAGDTLLSIDGVPVLSTRAIDPLEAAIRASHGRPVRILIQRQSTLVTLSA